MRCPPIDEDQVILAAMQLRAQRYSEGGWPVPVPFLNRLPERFHRTAVQEEVANWAKACLPIGSFMNLECTNYPCVFAFEPNEVSDSCIRRLSATRVRLTEGLLSIDDRPEPPLPPLILAEFRDPEDASYMGELPDKSRSTVRAWLPYLDVVAPDRPGRQDDRHSGFMPRVKDVLWDQLDRAR